MTPAQIAQLIDACEHDEVGGLLALKLPDTLKSELRREGRYGGKHEADARVAATLDRGDKWLAQTPQMFRIGTLMQALDTAGGAVTDESSAIEALGLQPLLVAGEAENFKLTWPADFLLAQRLMETR